MTMRTGLFFAFALAACTPAANKPPLTGPSLSGPHGDQPLELALKTYPQQADWSLEKERGSVVLLDVWATWCEPCRDSLPLYHDLQKEFGARGLKVYAMNVDADTTQIPKFLEETKVVLPVLLDPNAAVAEAKLKVRMMPTAFLIDRKGVVRYIHEGFAEEFLQKYMTEIEGLLAEPAK
jgi:cytochrome c biogenesis protein CcmG, thiol:disulfide interchange protein DsbE